MKKRSQQYSYGLISFCERKKLDLPDVVNKFITKHGFTGIDKDQTITDNWQKFASFVNEGLLKGELKGKSISVSNGSQERKQENIKAYARTPEYLRIWWQYIKSKGYDYNTGVDWFLVKFFNAYGLGSTLPKKTGAPIQILNNESRYEAIKDAGLLNEFFTFDPKLMSDFKPNKKKDNI